MKRKSILGVPKQLYEVGREIGEVNDYKEIRPNTTKPPLQHGRGRKRSSNKKDFTIDFS